MAFTLSPVTILVFKTSTPSYYTLKRIRDNTLIGLIINVPWDIQIKGPA